MRVGPGDEPGSVTATTAPPRQHPAPCARWYRACVRLRPRVKVISSRVESIRSRLHTVGRLVVASPGRFLGRCREVDLHLGLREDDRTDAAALDDASTVGTGPGPLALHEVPSDLRLAATTETVRPTAGERMSPVTSSPSMVTRSPTSMVDAAANCLRPPRRCRPGPVTVPGRVRPRPGTWRRYRAGPRQAARPPPSKRSICPLQPARRWPPAAGSGSRPPDGEVRQVLGERRVAGLDCTESGDRLCVPLGERRERPRPLPWPSGGLRDCRNRAPLSGPPRPVMASVSPAMVARAPKASTMAATAIRRSTSFTRSSPSVREHGGALSDGRRHGQGRDLVERRDLARSHLGGPQRAGCRPDGGGAGISRKQCDRCPHPPEDQDMAEPLRPLPAPATSIELSARRIPPQRRRPTQRDLRDPALDRFEGRCRTGAIRPSPRVRPSDRPPPPSASPRCPRVSSPPRARSSFRRPRGRRVTADFTWALATLEVQSMPCRTPRPDSVAAAGGAACTGHGRSHEPERFGHAVHWSRQERDLAPHKLGLPIEAGDQTCRRSTSTCGVPQSSAAGGGGVARAAHGQRPSRRRGAPRRHPWPPPPPGRRRRPRHRRARE